MEGTYKLGSHGREPIFTSLHIHSIKIITFSFNSQNIKYKSGTSASMIAQKKQIKNTQIHEYTNTRINKYCMVILELPAFSIKRNKYTNTQIHKYKNPQIHKYRMVILELPAFSIKRNKYTNTQVLEYTNTQIQMYKNTQILKYTNI